MTSYLDFEKPIAEIEGKLQELRHLSDDSGVNMLDEVSRLEGKVDRLLRQTYSRLTPWQKTQVARHQLRPHLLRLHFAPRHRLRASRGRPGLWRRPCGHRRARALLRPHHDDSSARRRAPIPRAGSRTTSAWPNPEGYRKAARLLRLAERFQVPVLTLIGHAGRPSRRRRGGARGQAEAIARCIEACLDVRVPVVALVIGEGGSGGAIALGVANRVLMIGARDLLGDLARGLAHRSSGATRLMRRWLRKRCDSRRRTCRSLA